MPRISREIRAEQWLNFCEIFRIRCWNFGAMMVIVGEYDERMTEEILRNVCGE